MTLVELTPEELLQRARDPRRWSSLVGAAETNRAEFHGTIYELRHETQKYELAKDVSGLANAGGGILIVGAATARDPHTGRDVINEVRPFAPELQDARQMEDMLREWVFPPLDTLLNVEKHVDTAGGSKCIVTLAIAQPPPLTGPHLITRYAKDTGKSGDVFFSLAGRHGGRTRAEPSAVVQGLIRDGLAYRSAAGVGRPTGMSQNPAAGPSAQVPTHRPTASPEVESLAVVSAGLQWPAAIFMGGFPTPKAELADHLVDRGSAIRTILANPPKWREHGWDLFAGDRVDAVAGESLVVAARGWGSIVVTKRGDIGVAYGPRLEPRESLSEDAELHRLNGLELAERALLFVELMAAIYAASRFQPESVLIRLTMRKLTEGAERLALGPYVPGTFGWQFRDDIRGSQKAEVIAESHQPWPLDQEVIAYELLRHVYAAFGTAMNDLPYLVEKGGRKGLSKEKFLAYVAKLQGRA